MFLLVATEKLLHIPIIATKWKSLSLDATLEVVHLCEVGSPLKSVLQSNFFNIRYDTEEQRKSTVHTKTAQTKIIVLFLECICEIHFPVSDFVMSLMRLGLLQAQELQMLRLLQVAHK
jgi:hypothetical protein